MSLVSDAGVRVENIACLVGHGGTVVTESAYRKELRPTNTEGARDHGPALHPSTWPPPKSGPPSLR